MSKSESSATPLQTLKHALANATEENVDVRMLEGLFDNLWISKMPRPSPIQMPLTEIRKSVQLRFAQYKNALHDITRVFLHYNPFNGQDFCVTMADRLLPGTYCDGVASNGSHCRVKLDQGTVQKLGWKEAFKTLEFDHSFDQAFIASAFLEALSNAIEKGRALAISDDEKVPGTKIDAGNWTIDYVKQHVKDIGKNSPTGVSSRIQHILSEFIKFDVILGDLYGERVNLRCPSCHAAVQSGTDHLPYDANRYKKG